MFENSANRQNTSGRTFSALGLDQCFARDTPPGCPDRIEWDAFLTTIRGQWEAWKKASFQYCPACLLMLYCGLAFYELRRKQVLPKFAKVVGSDETARQYTGNPKINTAFANAARQFCELKLRGNGMISYGSAVNLILWRAASLWDGISGGLLIGPFGIKSGGRLSDEEWGMLSKRDPAAGHELRRFLTENRKSASGFIQDVLDRARNPRRRSQIDDWGYPHARVSSARNTLTMCRRPQISCVRKIRIRFSDSASGSFGMSNGRISRCSYLR